MNRFVLLKMTAYMYVIVTCRFFITFLGELGDYDPVICRTGYLSEYQFFPGQVCTVCSGFDTCSTDLVATGLINFKIY